MQGLLNGDEFWVDGTMRLLPVALRVDTCLARPRKLAMVLTNRLPEPSPTSEYDVTSWVCRSSWTCLVIVCVFMVAD